MPPKLEEGDERTATSGFFRATKAQRSHLQFSVNVGSGIP